MAADEDANSDHHGKRLSLGFIILAIKPDNFQKSLLLDAASKILFAYIRQLLASQNKRQTYLGSV